MRVLHVDDDARASYIASTTANSGTIAIVAPGGGEPALAGATHLYKLSTAANTSSSAQILYHLARDCKEFTWESWVYLGDVSYGTQGDAFRILVAYYYRPSTLAESVRMYVSVYKHLTYYKFRLHLVNDSGANVGTEYYALINGTDPYLHPLTGAGQWFKIRVTWRAEVAGNDGGASLTIFDSDGTAQLGTIAVNDLATGFEPVIYLGPSLSNRGITNGVNSVYYADQVVHDNEDATDTPGVLCAFVHSATCRQLAARLRVICDRAVTAASCSVPGATVAAVTLADNDGGRIHEWALSGLEDEVAYTWSVVLDGTTVDADSYAGAGSTTFTPFPSRTAVLWWTDSHATLQSSATLKQAKSFDAMPTMPTHLCILGDCFVPYITTPPGGTTYGRATGRLMMHDTFRHLAPVSGKVVTVYTDGNHEIYDGSADSQAYSRIMSPRTNIDTPYTVQSTSVEFHVLNAVQYFALHGDDGYEAISDWLDEEIGASSRYTHVVMMHSFGVDIPTEPKDSGVPDFSPTGWGDIVTEIHTALAAHVAAGKRIFVFHGHIHGGGWWVKDGVVYVTIPPYRMAATKQGTVGDWTYPAGELDSRASSIDGWVQDGTQGWGYSLFAPTYSRHQLYDSALVAGVWTPHKVFEQWRMRR